MTKSLNFTTSRVPGLACAVAGACLLLSACSTNLNPPRIIDRSTYAPGSQVTQSTVVTKTTTALKDSGKTHRIAEGDTIYNISYRYGLDQGQLMRLNGITDPTQLKLGDVLRLPVAVDAPRPYTPNSQIRVNSVDFSKSAAAKPASKPAPEAKPVERVEPVPPASAAPVQPVLSGTRMIWPVKGKVVSNFAQNRRGIDIQGTPGDVVVASMDGQVLFANTLTGYGNTVMIRHANKLVSAYAHCDKITVKVGERVRAGQKIAELGGDDAKSVLRFEVRDNSGKNKAVDPMRYLPR